MHRLSSLPKQGRMRQEDSRRDARTASAGAITRETIALWWGWSMLVLPLAIWVIPIAGLVVLLWLAETASGFFYPPSPSFPSYPYRCSAWGTVIAWIEFTVTTCLVK